MLLSNESNLVVCRINFNFFQCPIFIPNARMIHIYYSKYFIVSNFTNNNIILLIPGFTIPTLAYKVNPFI